MKQRLEHGQKERYTMSRKKRVTRHRHGVPKKRKVTPQPQPNITINRVKRVIEPTVPDDIDLPKLAELYRLEGMKTGIMLTTMLPQKLIDAVVLGDLPKHIDTIVLMKMVKDGIEAAHQSSIDKLEKMQADLEELVGYEPIDEEGLAAADVFVRLITIPEEEGGGFCAELNANARGTGPTAADALEQLSAILADREEES